MTFVTPEGAAVTIEGQTPAEPGVFVLENGTYSYSVSKQGYNTATGSVTVNGESQRVDVNLGVETFSVTFNVTTPGAKITVTDAAGETIQPTAENANVYSLPNGEYHYIVSKLGCTSATGGFTVAGAAQTVGTIELAGAQLYTVTLTFTDDENASVTRPPSRSSMQMRASSPTRLVPSPTVCQTARTHTSSTTPATTRSKRPSPSAARMRPSQFSSRQTRPGTARTKHPSRPPTASTRSAPRRSSPGSPIRSTRAIPHITPG